MFRNSVRTGYGGVVGSAGDLAAVAEEGGDIVTKTEIAEILRSHDEWLGGADAGRRADLRNADLRGANLRDADLRGANLRGANLILAGQDIRGFSFYAYADDNHVVV